MYREWKEIDCVGLGMYREWKEIVWGFTVNGRK
jgi:hypothetical protein